MHKLPHPEFELDSDSIHCPVNREANTLSPKKKEKKNYTDYTLKDISRQWIHFIKIRMCWIINKMIHQTKGTKLGPNPLIWDLQKSTTCNYILHIYRENQYKYKACHLADWCYIQNPDNQSFVDGSSSNHYVQLSVGISSYLFIFPVFFCFFFI